MAKPICLKHMVDMRVSSNGASVHYPKAQYVYKGDIWVCPMDPENCAKIMVRAELPFCEGFHENYYTVREYALQMWAV